MNDKNRDELRSMLSKLGLEHEPRIRKTANFRKSCCVVGIVFCCLQFHQLYPFGFNVWGVPVLAGILYCCSIAFDFVANQQVNSATDEFQKEGDKIRYGEVLFKIHMGNRHRAWISCMLGFAITIVGNALCLKAKQGQPMTLF